MRICALLLVFGLSAYSQNVQSPACRTALDVPCYTIHAKLTQWQIFVNHSHDVLKWTSTYVNALRADGSRISISESSIWNPTGTSSSSKKSSVYLVPDKQILTIDYTKKTIASREPLIWHDLPYRRSTAHDNTCQSGIRHFGTDFTMKGVSKVANVDVVEWYRTLGNGGYEEQYLAPSLDCLPLKTYSIRKNSWGLPTFISSSEATSVDFRAPAPELFVLPSGYRQVEDPQRAVLLRMARAR
jgi:hypothetical protein